MLNASNKPGSGICLFDFYDLSLHRCFRALFQKLRDEKKDKFCSEIVGAVYTELVDLPRQRMGIGGKQGVPDPSRTIAPSLFKPYEKDNLEGQSRRRRD